MGRIHMASRDFVAALELRFEIFHDHILTCRSCRTFFQVSTRKTLCVKGGDMFSEIMVAYSRIRFVSVPDGQKAAAARFMNAIRRRNDLAPASELDNPPTLF